MRITNKIMQNNSLNNVNYNKVLMDKYNSQMSSQKKINRPSDDPVVAIRALRLRSNVAEVTQYYSKNIPDAESWLSVTEGALDNVVTVITDMYKQCTKGSSGELTSEDREIILESLKALRDEVYATGDADYAGRYVFTGYRTDTSLMFPETTSQTYEITEQLDKASADTMTFVNTTIQATDANGDDVTLDLYDTNTSNYEDIGITEQNIEAMQVHRIRLAYSGLLDVAPELKHMTLDATGNKVESYYVDKDGKEIKAEHVKVTNSYELPNPYTESANNPDSVIFVKDTGELLLGENIYNQVLATKDNPKTSGVDEGEIRVTYQKKEWDKGDLRPEHYFACTTDPGTDDAIKYNHDYLESMEGSTQIIEYDVGFNQSLRVNSTADECFKHGVGREVDDLIKALENTIEMQKVVADLESVLEAKKGTNEEAVVKQRLDAANKAYTLLKDSTQRLFESGMTTMQEHLAAANLAVTNNGTRGQKLALIENRMMTQKTTFETLKSENEDADIADATIKLTTANMVYEASLMATSKVMQNTLLDFI